MDYFLKGMKGDSVMKIDFIPIEYDDIRHSKTSFKKLMRACVPSSTSNEPEHSFYKLVKITKLFLILLK